MWGDPLWPYVVLLAFNENGANGSTAFVDQSKYVRTLTARGTPSASWTTANPPPGMTSSAIFDGVVANNQKVTAPYAAELSLLGYDWTFESSAYINGAQPQEADIFMSGCGGVTDLSLEVQLSTISTNPQLFGFLSSSGATWDISAGDLWNQELIVLNTWNHVAISRWGNYFYAHVNGRIFANSLSSLWDNRQLHDTTTTSCTNGEGIQLGGDQAAGQFLKGQMGPTRLTVGRVRYPPLSFAVPTGPLPNFYSPQPATKRARRLHRDDDGRFNDLDVKQWF